MSNQRLVSIKVTVDLMSLLQINFIASLDLEYFIVPTNDLPIGCQNLNLLSHSNATLVPQVRQARASGENLNYVTLAPQARPSGVILNYSLSH